MKQRKIINFATTNKKPEKSREQREQLQPNKTTEKEEREKTNRKINKTLMLNFTFTLFNLKHQIKGK